MTRPPAWTSTHHAARWWRSIDGTAGEVECQLSPRHCRIRPGQAGFCGVRRNVEGELRSFNYGKSVMATQEVVETEAVYHFAPGARILSMGNLGCMLHCDYCHNWRTSQARHVKEGDVHHYTPEDVVALCLEMGLSIISWTYNDPVVWQEFVIDTAKIARQHGILSLYKSAFAISLPAAQELLEYMDVFSLSLKTMNAATYHKITKGELEPVLDAIRVVAASGRHLEISNLVVPLANDTADDAARVADWVLTHCGPDTPLHYVRFHPDYRYLHVERTPVEVLERARSIARSAGMRHVYLGNVFDHAGGHTDCPVCGRRAVSRNGMSVTLENVDLDGTCSSCRSPLGLARVDLSLSDGIAARSTEVEQTCRRLESSSDATATRDHTWLGDILSFHVEVHNPTEQSLWVAALPNEGVGVRRAARVGPGRRMRIMVARSGPAESRVRITSDPGLNVEIVPLMDRAHFPPAEGRDDSSGDATRDSTP